MGMTNLLLLLVCFSLGVLLRCARRLPEYAPSVLNAVIIHVSLPALILLHVHRGIPELALLYPALMPWILFGLGMVFFRTVGQLARWAPATTGGLIFSSSLANTSFVGLPMIEAFYGVGELATGIVIDQLGTYLVLSTVGIVVAALYSGDAVSAAAVGQKILRFPPFQALVLALLLRPFAYPAGVEPLLERLGATLAPLALISVGFQVRVSDFRGRMAPLCLGLVFKLLVGPALILFLFVGLLGMGGRPTQIMIFEAAMGPQIGGAIVAMEHKLDPPLVTLMVGLGILLSFLTVPLWWYLLRGL